MIYYYLCKVPFYIIIFHVNFLSSHWLLWKEKGKTRLISQNSNPKLSKTTCIILAFFLFIGICDLYCRHDLTFPIRLLLLYFQINLHIQTNQDEENGNFGSKS
jgi:hypothetical protein